MQHRVKLASFVHASDSVAAEGRNAHVAAVAPAERVAVLTTNAHVHLYRLAPTNAAKALPLALQRLSGSLRPAELRLYQSVDLQRFGSAYALAAGAQQYVPCQAAAVILPFTEPVGRKRRYAC